MRELARRVGFTIVACLFATFGAHGTAKDAPTEAADPALEARMVRVASELRCLVCQNQTIADSHAALAIDLRRQVREQLRAGRTDAEIIDYMTARYGDFVLYRPPFKATTAALWLGPAAMLAVGLAVLFVVLRRRGRLAPDAFDADADDQADDEADGHANHVADDPRFASANAAGTTRRAPPDAARAAADAPAIGRVVDAASPHA